MQRRQINIVRSFPVIVVKIISALFDLGFSGTPADRPLVFTNSAGLGVSERDEAKLNVAGVAGVRRSGVPVPITASGKMTD